MVDIAKINPKQILLSKLTKLALNNDVGIKKIELIELYNTLLPELSRDSLFDPEGILGHNQKSKYQAIIQYYKSAKKIVSNYPYGRTLLNTGAVASLKTPEYQHAIKMLANEMTSEDFDNLNVMAGPNSDPSFKEEAEELAQNADSAFAEKAPFNLVVYCGGYLDENNFIIHHKSYFLTALFSLLNNPRLSPEELQSTRHTDRSNFDIAASLPELISSGKLTSNDCNTLGNMLLQLLQNQIPAVRKFLAALKLVSAGNDTAGENIKKIIMAMDNGISQPFILTLNNQSSITPMQLTDTHKVLNAPYFVFFDTVGVLTPFSNMQVQTGESYYNTMSVRDICGNTQKYVKEIDTSEKLNKLHITIKTYLKDLDAEVTARIAMLQERLVFLSKYVKIDPDALQNSVDNIRKRKKDNIQDYHNYSSILLAAFPMTVAKPKNMFAAFEQFTKNMRTVDEATQPEIKPHITRVYFNGFPYVALDKKGSNEWTWLKLGGPNPQRNKPELFLPNHLIYKLPRFYDNSPFDLPKEILPQAQPTKPFSKEVEIRVPEELQNPLAAYQFAEAKGSPQPDLEFYIAKSPKFSYLYAVKILKHRFFKGEPAISSDSGYWSHYKERFNME